jgi:sugar/nucleoside kinase (ribokinase family)
VLNGSVRGEIGADVIGELRKTKALVAADAQAFIRIASPDGTLRHAPWPEREQFLSQMDILKADGVEAHALTGERDLHKAARALAGLGPPEIVLTHRHGVAVFAEGEFVEAEFCPRQCLGRSGRGDTCLGAYVAKRLTSPPEEATNWAVAVTSLKLEAEGPIRRPLAEVTELYNRISKSGTRERAGAVN